MDKYRLMEQADEKQIQQEINGEHVDELVYSIDGKNHLSYAGVRYAVNLYGGLRVTQVECQYNQVLGQYEATVYAENTKNEVRLPGVAEHPGSKDGIKDLFARRTAVSKATRNALHAVLPVEFREKVTQDLLDRKYGSLEVSVDSVTSYLKQNGVNVSGLVIKESKQDVHVHPYRCLDPGSWCQIDAVLTRIHGSWREDLWVIPQ